MCCRWHIFLLFVGVTQILAKKQPIHNVDTNFTIIFTAPSTSDPTDANQRFGQGLAIGDNGVAFIGAPKSDIHGNLFRCDFAPNEKRKQNITDCAKTPGSFF